MPPCSPLEVTLPLIATATLALLVGPGGVRREPR